MVKTICPQCGAVSEIKSGSPSEDWLECVLPTGFEWRLPAGKIEMATGAVFYIDAVGNKMTREEYLERYNIDPEVAYQNMRSKAAKPFFQIGGR
jgi:hypothetical protein